ncbi:MAG: hypothetical protein WAM39_25860 [Bryobacteraceae bacterium]
MSQSLAAKYESLKMLAASDLKSPAVGGLLFDMARDGSATLWQQCHKLEMKSKVRGKEYIAFASGERMSRPFNSALYVEDSSALDLAQAFINAPTTLSAADATRAAYTIAMSVIGANEVSGVGRKASATFFEVLIGHMVATAIGVNPSKKVKMPEDPSILLPTDYVFDLGHKKPKIHLPIKTSTRERVVQAWVHQLVLKTIFGNKVYRGLLVVISETKGASKTRIVTEICIPGQIALFQSRIVELERMYYLDPPERYLALATAEPMPVDVRPFGDFFAEVKQLTVF